MTASCVFATARSQWAVAPWLQWCSTGGARSSPRGGSSPPACYEQTSSCTHLGVFYGVCCQALRHLSGPHPTPPPPFPLDTLNPHSSFGIVLRRCCVRSADGKAVFRSHHFNDGSQSDMYGGYCSNKNMIAGFTYQSSNNNAYVHSGAFSNFLPNHCRYKQYYLYRGPHCDRPCESWKGVAIYACQMY